MESGTEKIDLGRVQFTGELVRCVPPEVARRFDLLPVVIGYGGAGFFLLHAVSLWDRGSRWVAAKLAFLGLYWITVGWFVK
jgi:hypothetical protein